MRTNIEIDDELMRQALLGTGSKTKKEVVDTALRLLLRTLGQRNLLSLKGIAEWEGDLHESRLDRFPDDWDVKE